MEAIQSKRPFSFIDAIDRAMEKVAQMPQEEWEAMLHARDLANAPAGSDPDWYKKLSPEAAARLGAMSKAEAAKRAAEKAAAQP